MNEWTDAELMEHMANESIILNGIMVTPFVKLKEIAFHPRMPKDKMETMIAMIKSVDKAFNLPPDLTDHSHSVID